jgi:serine phosphatase RsbU (regulator of sigma subunit)
LLYWDGVTEALDRNPNMFGSERLKEVLGRQHDLALGSLQAGKLGEVERFVNGANQSGDIMLLAARYRRPEDGAGTVGGIPVTGQPV